MSDSQADTMAAVKKVGEAYDQIRGELSKVIVGQEAVIDELLISLFARGHALLVGVPGLAKTKLIATVAAAEDAGRAARRRCRSAR